MDYVLIKNTLYPIELSDQVREAFNELIRCTQALMNSIAEYMKSIESYKDSLDEIYASNDTYSSSQVRRTMTPFEYATCIFNKRKIAHTRNYCNRYDYMRPFQKKLPYQRRRY